MRKENAGDYREKPEQVFKYIPNNTFQCKEIHEHSLTT